MDWIKNEKQSFLFVTLLSYGSDILTSVEKTKHFFRRILRWIIVNY